MFYCDPCKQKNDWPGFLFSSFGKCEVCGSHTGCYDVPSRLLPKPSEAMEPKIPNLTALDALLNEPNKFEAMEDNTYDGTKMTGKVFRIKGTDIKLYEYSTAAIDTSKYRHVRTTKDASSLLLTIPVEWIVEVFVLPEGATHIIDKDGGDIWELVTEGQHEGKFYCKGAYEYLSAEDIRSEYGIETILGELK